MLSGAPEDVNSLFLSCLKVFFPLQNSFEIAKEQPYLN